MCGITGIYHYSDSEREVDPNVLASMTAALKHRGPDGEGIWVDKNIGLGHRRLAVIDTSERGSQPMSSEQGDAVITFNGEIYNFRELRQQLESKGHVFRSNSDTEVILAAYREWDLKVVDHLSGIFAFGIWDKKNQRLFLARDPLGVKPLFYSIDSSSCRFASEIKGIISDPDITREFDLSALHSFFSFSYTPAPKTGFKQVRQLPPAHCVLIDENGPKTWRYWDIKYDEELETKNFSDLLEQFNAELDRVTASQMVSDVPLGAFLSGGLDSAAIVRSMSKVRKTNLGALCVGFKDSDFDESALAKQSAEQLGVPIQVEELTYDPADLLPKLSLHTEEPFADSSIFATYLLCQTARKNFTVCLSGDGADEMLAGYDTFRATALSRYYRPLPGIFRNHIVKPLAKLLPVTDQKYSLYKRANRFAYAAALATPALTHAAWRIIVDSDLERKLFTKDFYQSTRETNPLNSYARYASVPPKSRGPLLGLLHADTSFYLPNDMLVKVDRMSMAHGLEVRVPFLDKDFVQFAANLPDEAKLHQNKIRKRILRESLRGSIPDSVINAPKSGFNVPLERWMRGELREMLLDNVNGELSHFLNPGSVHALAKAHHQRKADHAHVLFSILMFTQWLDNAKNAWKTPNIGIKPESKAVSRSLS